MMALDEARMESTAETNMKSRCCDFLVEAAKQVQQRLPANIQIWKSMAVFSPHNKEDSHAEAFWVEVLNYKDSRGDSAFKELALFCLSLLEMPLSNADVERVFSQMSLVKSKLRNKMGQETLSNILHIKYGLRRKGICCKDYVPTKEMIQRFNCRMYMSGASETPDTDEDSEDEY